MQEVGLWDESSQLHKPLAERLRPKTLDEVVGQDHLLGENGKLRKLLKRKSMPSLILYGPPGTGKTTLARLLAQEAGLDFAELSAVAAGVAQVKEIVLRSQKQLAHTGRGTLLFLDEIHRFNRAQQDALLPHVESGLLHLIGATTENPYHSINRPLLSRLQVYELKLINETALQIILANAMKDNELIERTLSADAKQRLIELARGDARTMLGWLEAAGLMSDDQCIDRHDIDQASQKQPLLFDRAGDWHYNTISAYIKSMRQGDEDGALTYLASMIAGGEDPIFIARRLMIFASEDIGLADPQAITLATSTHYACQNLGLPECRINLSHATIYCARAPKDRQAYNRINEELDQVKSSGNPDIPFHLRNQ